MNRNNLNPTKSKKRTQRKFKIRISVFLLSIFLIGSLVGGLITNCFSNDTPESNIVDVSNFYGTRDGKSFVEEPDIYWENKEIQFELLDCNLGADVQEFIFYLSYSYYIDYPMVMALIEKESSFNPEAESKTHDSGLMQINICNQGWLSDTLDLDDYHDPYQNVRAGLYILRGLFEKYDDTSKVLMAYNMGEYGASVLWKQGIYETKYSKSIMKRADEIASEIGWNSNE